MFTVVFSSIAYVSAFETEGVPVTALKIPHGFGEPIHQDITRDGLSFLKSEPLKLIVGQHIIIEQDQSSPNHFDNCQFQETIQRINSRYDDAVQALNPNPGHTNLTLAAQKFGHILHSAQDFYAHSNWIEMKRTDLIDPWFTKWVEIRPFSFTTNDEPVFSLEVGKPGDTRSHFYSRSLDSKVVSVKNGTNSYPKIGLISGTFDADVNKCPSDASIPHGGKLLNRFFRTPEATEFTNELNKDNPAIKGHAAARKLATDQTTHEFCRLVELTRDSWGDAGVKSIYDNWVQNTNVATSKCPILITPKTSLPNGSGISIENQQSLLLPSWFKNNAKWWEDGLISDNEIVFAIENLIDQNVITVKNTVQQVPSNGEPKIPTYIKDVFGFWSQDKVSDSEIANSLQFLIKNGVIRSQNIDKKQVQLEYVITDKEVIKNLHHVSSWQEYGAFVLLEIKNYESNTLKEITDNTWKEYSINKNHQLMTEAQELDSLEKKAREQSLDVVLIQKNIKNNIKMITDIARKMGISEEDLAEETQDVNQKRESFKKIESQSNLVNAYETGNNAFERADIMLVNLPTRFSGEDNFLTDIGVLDKAISMLHYGPLVKKVTQSEDGESVMVLAIGDKFYPVMQFISAHPDSCEEFHYHSPFAQVRSIDGMFISDHDKPNCGFGKVNAIPIKEVFMTKKQIDAFIQDTGMTP